MNEMVECNKNKEVSNDKDSYSKVAMEIYAYCMSLNPLRYNKKTKEEMKVEKLAIEHSISNIPLKIVKKMVELAVKKAQEEHCTFNIDLVLGRYVCAKYLVRNNMESFDELWTNLDDVEI